MSDDAAIKLTWWQRTKAVLLLGWLLLTFWRPFFLGLRAAFDYGPWKYDTVPEEYERWADKLGFCFCLACGKYLWRSGRGHVSVSRKHPEEASE